MSTPANPLDKYRSYSYHHILIIANSTAVLDAMSETSFSYNDLLQRTTDRSTAGVARSVKSLPGKEENKYVVAINGMQDADFFVSDVEWENVMTPRWTGGTQHFTSMGVEGTIKVSEPKAARFFRYMDDVFSALETAPTACVFILKTIFVGHDTPTNNGTENVKHVTSTISNIKPIGFTLYNIDSNFTAAGATYDLHVIGIINGTSKNPHYANGIRKGGNNLRVFNDESLFSVMNRMEQNINDTYDAEWKRHNVNKDLEDRFRQVEYKIHLDAWYRFPETYKVDDFAERQGEVFRYDTVRTFLGGCESGFEVEATTQAEIDDLNSQWLAGVISFPPKTSVDNAINLVMSHCSEVLKEAGKKPEEGETEGKKTYTYKIETSIDSTYNSTQEGGGKYIINYYIIRTKAAEQTSDEARSGVYGNSPVNDGNVIEFDYIFTGKNIDITEFDINIEMGLLLLLSRQASSNTTDSKEGIKDGKQADNDKLISGSNEDGQFSRGKQRAPFSMPKVDTSAATLNSVYPSDRAEFTAALNRTATLSALDVKLNIRGNPLFVNDLSVSPAQFRRQFDEAKTEADKVNSVMGNWQRVPGLVKLNIKMPSDPDGSNPGAYENFWYRGYYQIISVAHKFDNGVFSQELSMIALPQAKELPHAVSDTTNEESVADLEKQKQEEQPVPEETGIIAGAKNWIFGEEGEPEPEVAEDVKTGCIEDITGPLP